MITKDKITPSVQENCYTIRQQSIIIPISEFKIARNRFRCILCGTVVSPGEICIEENGVRTCTCIMQEKPKRKLIPVAEYKQLISAV